MTEKQALLAIFLCGLCTLALRAAPFLLFGGKRTMPRTVRRIADMLPAAIMAALVVYCLKGARDEPLAQSWPMFAAAAFVALVHQLLKKTWLSVLAGTALYMVLIRIF